MSLIYLDLFSGAGGLSLGFDYAGFRQLLSIELEPVYCETYRVNFPHHRVLQQDLTQLSNEQASLYHSDIPNRGIAGVEE